MKIGTKLFLGFFSVIFLFVIGFCIVYLQLNEIQNNVRDLISKSELNLTLSEVRSIFRAKVIGITEYTLHPQDQLIDVYNEHTTQQNALFSQVQHELKSAEQQKLFASVVHSDQNINDTFLNQIVPAVGSGDREKAIRLNQSSVFDQREIITTYIDKLIDSVNKQREETKKLFYQKVMMTILVLLAVVAGSITASIGITFFIGRRIIQPIKQIHALSTRLAAGDLTLEKIKVKSKDEIGELSAEINVMVENIRALVEEASIFSQKVASSSEGLVASSGELTSAIEQISEAAQKLSSGTITQAEQASKTVQIIEQVASDIQRINRNNDEMALSSKIVGSASKHGLHSVRQFIQQMNRIQEKVLLTAQIIRQLDVKSGEINQIVTVINDIASQTNLLALNAAIEAARAGEQGRGFAVVADEVRILAEQVTRSTHEISQIIKSVQHEAAQAGKSMNEVVEQVQAGSTMIDENGKAFEQIVQLIDEMSVKINEVAKSSTDIYAQSGLAVKSVHNISAVTDESSAAAEELAATILQQNTSMQKINEMANQLSAFAKQLNMVIFRFKL